MKKVKPKVNQDLRGFLPVASDDLRLALKEKIFRDGVLEPIQVAEDFDIVDGYTRFDLYRELGILKYPVVVVPDLKTEEDKKRWMRDHQLHRRNLTTNEWSYFWGLKFNEEKLSQGNPNMQRAQNEPIDNEQENKGRTSERLGEESGSSPATIKRAGEFAAAVEKQHKNVRASILAGSVPAALVIEADGKPLFCDICIRRGCRRGCEQCDKKRAAIAKPKGKGGKRTGSMFSSKVKDLKPLHEELIASCAVLPDPVTKKSVQEWRARIGRAVEVIEHLLLEKE